MAASFLLRYQEQHPCTPSVGMQNATKTMTETRESNDRDINEIVMGTLTKTSTREGSDQDPSIVASATKTMTAVKSESSDSDASSFATYRALPLANRPETFKQHSISLGTMTGTRAREERDQDISNKSYNAIPLNQ